MDGTEQSHFSALGATDAQAFIRRGELSPVDLLEACIARIESVNPRVNAIVTAAFDRARVEAAEAERAVRDGRSLGPLHGLPVAIKDNQLTAGIRTTLGSPLRRDDVPTTDAGIVARIRAAGGIVVGKTNIPEFSIGANTVNPLFGATGNPFDPSLTCGGSSGGSAVAVACNMVPLATGSDHGGSLRIPASFCGVVGYRATPGVVPNEERLITQTNYSVQGPIARTVADAALLLSVIAGRELGGQRDPMAFPLDAGALGDVETVPEDGAAPRIAASTDLGGILVSDHNRRLFESRVARISQVFANCEKVDLDLADAPDVDWHLRQDVFATQYHDQAADWPEDFNPNVRATYDAAVRATAGDIAGARRRQLDLVHRMQVLFEDFDVLLIPGMSVPPFPWRDLYPQVIDGKPVENYMAWLGLTAAITVVGHPVVSLPCGVDDTGMPFGIQLIGPMYGDQRLLAIAHRLEQALASTTDLGRPVPVFDQDSIRTSGRPH